MRVRLRVRLPGSARFIEQVRPPSASLRFAVDGLANAPALDYSLALLDEYGNRLWQRGADDAPEHLTVTPSATSDALVGPVSAPSAHNPTPYYVIGSLALVAGGGALAGGVLAHIERERLATRWNQGDCSGAGSTRASLCAHERSQLSKMQTLAGVAYGVGGAALVTGIILFLLAPAHNSLRAPENAPAARAFRCRNGPGEIGMGCAVEF